MCGITGFISSNKDINEKYIKSSLAAIKHRGPDSDGIYFADGIFLGNTRLSIIDIENGQQPFMSEDKKIVVVQNGEIYNYLELKKQLKDLGCIFNTSSDTEVILKAYETYGTSCFAKFNGMFAIAILDLNTHRLVLGRDRLGVKPLYIYRDKDGVFFASEIKAFFDKPSFDFSLNYQAIHNYMKFNYIPYTETIFNKVTQVSPGSFIDYNIKTFKEVSTEYWNLKDNNITNYASRNEIIENVEHIIEDAIKIRMRSDVPVGAFLSGGLDSSVVCAIAKKKLNISLETFTIGFNDQRFDESPYAKEVAQYLKLKNNVKFLDNDILSLWPQITWYNDQPHGDISYIPTFILSQEAAKKYKLVLTGDGGDEVFGGYEKYLDADSLTYKEYFDKISLIKNDRLFDELYTPTFRRQININKPFDIFSSSISEIAHQNDKINQMLYFDAKHLLPGNNLVKPDRMGLANGLEARSPLLDYRLFDFMYTVSGIEKINSNTTKFLFKELALKYLPKDVVYRKKQMFTVPVGEWFKASARNYISELLSSSSFRSRGIFQEDFIQYMLNMHIQGSSDFTREIRAIANLEIWMRKFVDNR